MESTIPYGLIVRFSVREGCVKAFDALVFAMQEHMRAEEPETLQYELHGIPGDETARVLVETYCSRAAFAFHERQPYTRVFLQERARYLQGEPEVIELTPLSPLHRVP